MHVLHLPHPASTDALSHAHWLGAAPDDCPRVLCLPGNPLADGWNAPTLAPEGAALVAWSGTLGDSLWKAHPLTWMTAGWTRLREVLTALAPELRRRRQRLFVRTHCCHVVADVHAAQRLLGECDAIDPALFGILPDPASMFTAAMLPRAEDHLARMTDALPRLAGPMGVLVRNLAAPSARAARAADSHGEGFQSAAPVGVPLHAPGVFDLEPLIRACAAAGINRFAIEGAEPEPQAAALKAFLAPR